MKRNSINEQGRILESDFREAIITGIAPERMSDLSKMNPDLMPSTGQRSNGREKTLLITFLDLDLSRRRSPLDRSLELQDWRGRGSAGQAGIHLLGHSFAKPSVGLLVSGFREGKENHSARFTVQAVNNQGLRVGRPHPVNQDGYRLR